MPRSWCHRDRRGPSAAARRPLLVELVVGLFVLVRPGIADAQRHHAVLLLPVRRPVAVEVVADLHGEGVSAEILAAIAWASVGRLRPPATQGSSCQPGNRLWLVKMLKWVKSSLSRTPLNVPCQVRTFSGSGGRFVAGVLTARDAHDRIIRRWCRWDRAWSLRATSSCRASSPTAAPGWHIAAIRRERRRLAEVQPLRVDGGRGRRVGDHVAGAFLRGQRRHRTVATGARVPASRKVTVIGASVGL